MRSQTLVLHSSQSFIQHIILKRMFDISFSLFVLLFFSPLFLLIAISVRLSSRGPAIYRQKRIGRGGKSFHCLKFRTMVDGAESILQNLLDENPSLKSEWDQYQKLKKDPRTFFVGRLLRKSSLDELPQFWNVLKGELSVVGPRPYLESQRDHLGMWASQILSLRPGITGLWQTSGRSSITFRERIEIDALYVEMRSFWFDMLLIAKTIPLLLFSKNAF